MSRDLLRADGGRNEGEIDVVETYGGGMDTGIAESTVHFSQTGGKGRGLAVPPRPDPTKWRTHGMERAFDACFGADATYHICLTTHTGRIHKGRLNHDGFTQTHMDIDYIVVRAMGQ